MDTQKGKLITFCGIDEHGVTQNMVFLTDMLKEKGFKVHIPDFFCDISTKTHTFLDPGTKHTL